MPTAQTGDRAEYQDLVPLFDQLADESLPEYQRREIRARLVAEHLPVA
jgi:hypothetical protein